MVISPTSQSQTLQKIPLRLNKHQTQQYAHTALRPLLFCLGLALEAAYLRCNKSEGCSPTPTPSLHKSQDSANEVSLIMDRKKGPRWAGTSQTTIKRIIKNNNPPKGRRKKVIPFIHVCVCAYIYIYIYHITYRYQPILLKMGFLGSRIETQNARESRKLMQGEEGAGLQKQRLSFPTVPAERAMKRYP